MARGCLLEVGEKKLAPLEGYGSTILLLPETKKQWDKVDGTIPHGPNDDACRYRAFTNGNLHSAAVDATLFCAIMLDAGRLQIDQISFGQARQLNNPAALLRTIVRTPWGLLPQEKRDNLRDGLLKELEQYNPNQFATSDCLDIINVLEVCFDGLPQLSSTVIKAGVCCNQKITILSNRNAIRDHMLLIQKGTVHPLQALINLYYCPTTYTSEGSSSPCDLGSLCTKQVRGLHYILDRSSPSFLLTLSQPISRVEEDIFKGLQGFKLGHYWNGLDRDVVLYETVGCILKRSDNRYLCRWKNGDKILQYDGMESAEVLEFPGGSWYQGCNTAIVAIFYRQTV